MEGTPLRANSGNGSVGQRFEERRADEDVLLDSIVHLCHFMKLVSGTVKTKLAGIRYHHMIKGHGDTLKDKSRCSLPLEESSAYKGQEEGCGQC